MSVFSMLTSAANDQEQFTSS